MFDQSLPLWWQTIVFTAEWDNTKLGCQPHLCAQSVCHETTTGDQKLCVQYAAVAQLQHYLVLGFFNGGDFRVQL